MTFANLAPVLVALAASCAAPPAPIVAVAPRVPEPPLARFMREEVNVPFAFMMLETASAQRRRRVHKAAVILREAANDLVHWSDPPVVTGEGREVFYAYAENLEHHVARLEVAADHQETVATVEQIRQTCNQCHRFFRPASVISQDVAYDWYAPDLGGFP